MDSKFSQGSVLAATSYLSEFHSALVGRRDFLYPNVLKVGHVGLRVDELQRLMICKDRGYLAPLRKQC